MKIIVYKNQVREKLISDRRRNAGDENQKMKITTTPTKHKDSATFKVSADGVQIGFVFETRYSWGYCNARRGGLPKSWVATEAKDKEDAIEKLITADAGLIEMMKSLRTTGEWTFKK